MTRAAVRDRRRACEPRRRATRQLDLTLRILAASDQHPTAEQLYRAASVRLPGMSRGTVYRNLAKLVAIGRARVVHVHDRSARYDARLDLHDHFLCTRCAMLLDIDDAGDGRPTRSRSRVRGHRVDGRTLTYFGLCRACEGRT